MGGLTIPNLFWSWIRLLLTVLRWCARLVLGRSYRSPQTRILLQKQKSAQSYAEWKHLALEIDRLEQKDLWKLKKETTEYDWQFIDGKLESLSSRADDATLVHELRTGLLRNLGGMANPCLHATSQTGTKQLIETYLDTVVAKLQRVASPQFTSLSDEDKFQFFYETRQSYGRTALLLSGGAGLGLYHIGVLKALHEAKLLPRVISGSSVGSIFAAIACVTPDSEFETLFGLGSLDLQAFEEIGKQKGPGALQRRLKRLLHKRVLFDIRVLERCIRENVGEWTFYEAFLRTGRILNITVKSAGGHERTRLLNYITAPNVLIWSASAASCALPGLYAPVQLKTKDNDGNMRNYYASSLKQKWSDGSVGQDLPMDRLSQLFNVNNFLVSQVNPPLIPYLNAKFKLQNGSWLGRGLAGLLHLTISELKHRLSQLAYLGLVPGPLASLVHVTTQTYEGDITLVPPFELSDFSRLTANPTRDLIRVAMTKGERVTWSKLSQIENHLKIEMALEDGVASLRQKIYGPRPASEPWARCPTILDFQRLTKTSENERQNQSQSPSQPSSPKPNSPRSGKRKPGPAFSSSSPSSSPSSSSAPSSPLNSSAPPAIPTTTTTTTTRQSLSPSPAGSAPSLESSTETLRRRREHSPLAPAWTRNKDLSSLYLQNQAEPETNPADISSDTEDM